MPFPSQSSNRNEKWRRGWDLNPRWSFPHSGFRDRCTKPLCDLSASETMKDESRTMQNDEVRTAVFHSTFIVLRSSLLFARLARKNSCIIALHSSSSTPDVISIR